MSHSWIRSIDSTHVSFLSETLTTSMSHSWIRNIDYTHVSFLNQKHWLHPCLILESETLTTPMSHFWIRNIDYTHVSFLNQKHWLHPCFIPESETLTAPCSLRIARYYLVVPLFQLKFTTEIFYCTFVLFEIHKIFQLPPYLN